VFHGYYFRRLAGSGNRFATIAYPAAYRSSGVMTFIIDPDGAAYEKDLGPNTGKVAGRMTGYSIDRTWTPAEATRAPSAAHESAQSPVQHASFPQNAPPFTDRI